MENDCQLADLVLPSLTMMEVDDIGCDSLSAIFYVVFHEPRAIEPRGESKSDYEIVCAIAERFGILEEYTGGKSVDDWIKVGYETCGVAGDVSFEELKEKGYFVVPHDTELPNDGKAGLLDFYEDPEGHPLTTPSGKIEFYWSGWPRTSPTMSSGRPCRAGSPRESRIRRVEMGSGARSIRCSSSATIPGGGCTPSTTT